MKRVFGLILLMVSCVGLTGCFGSDKNIAETFEKKVKKLKSYHISGELEIMNNEDSHKYNIDVAYKEEDNFRVSLKNKTNNHEQIILKNDNGVYVLTPALNKSFKFQSKWPYNNSQSYLLQSIINDMKSDSKLTMKKVKDGYLFTSKVNYKNNANLIKQQVLFDKNLNIKEVNVLDSEQNPQIKVKFSSVDMRAKFKKNYFEIEENMETLATEDTKTESKELDEAIYPMYLPSGTYLDTEKTVELDKGSRIILTFSGDTSFMLVEETASKSDELSVIPTSGDLDMVMDSIAVIGDSSINWISDNVEYYLVSSDMSKSELINVAKSISVMPVSK